MICLTFDTDHMSAEQLKSWLKSCTYPGSATFFCTGLFHFLVDGEKANEVAPHPFLDEGASWGDEMLNCRKRFPDAKSWRAHSLTDSQALMVELGKTGYDIASTVEMFGCKKPEPIFSPWGIWQMPIYYMDNTDFNRPDFGTLGAGKVFSQDMIDTAIHGDGVYVFDFHPIHYQLNTPNYQHYVKNFAAFKDNEDIAKLRYEGYGTQSFFNDLCKAMLEYDVVSLTLTDALSAWKKQQS